ncbi:MAG: hypothetical protein Q9181_004302, partial [Wetmoreana brouardii]
MPWESYLQSRLGSDQKDRVTLQKFGHNINLAQANWCKGGLLGVIMKYNIDIAKVASSACDNFAKVKAKQPLDQVLKLPQGAFDRKKGEL